MQAPTAASTTVFYDGRAAEMICAFVDANGALCTLEFHETRADTGEVELARGVEWDKRAPGGMGLLIPQAGELLVKLDEFWWMWREGSLLFGQAVHSPLVLAAVLEGGERLIERPVIAANGELHAYAWRGGRLVRHRFVAGRDGNPRVSTEDVWETAAAPLRSVCAPVPGGDGVLIGMVDETGDVLTARVLLVRGKSATVLEGVTEGRYRLMGRHRMGIHVGTKRRPALGLMAESRDDGAYAVLEAQFDLAKGECVWRRTRLEFLAPGSLQSAGVFFHKSQNAPEAFALAVDGAGDLVWLRKRIVELVRAGVGGDYGYPILTTMQNRYEAVGVGRETVLRRF